MDAEPTGVEQKPVASAREIKALAHPLRLRILRLCGLHELTNKQLADRLGQDPGTMLYHVRQLLSTGFLEPAEVRTGESGALEKPYRSAGRSWNLDTALRDACPDGPLAPIEAFREELTEAGPDAISGSKAMAIGIHTAVVFPSRTAGVNRITSAARIAASSSSGQPLEMLTWAARATPSPSTRIQRYVCPPMPAARCPAGYSR